MAILTSTSAILDLIEVPKDNLAFIVMEEWSSQLVAATPCNLGLFLDALRQCIEVGHPDRSLHKASLTLSGSI